MYISLHQHSTYSLGDAVGTVAELVSLAKENKMSALAITDHGNIKCWPNLYDECTKVSIKPIFAVEAYFVDDIDVEQEYAHIVLIAKNKEGYHNLIKLCSFAGTEGFYYRPRIDRTRLMNHHDGLIVLTACAGGILSKPYAGLDKELAYERLDWLHGLFRDDLYLELQRHDTCAKDILDKVNPWLVSESKKRGIKLVVTNDSHYPKKEDSVTHEIILCRRQKGKMTDKKRNYFYDSSFWFKNESDMLKLFPDFPDAVHESGKIAEKVESFDPREHKYNFPEAEVDGKWLTEPEAAIELGKRTHEVLKRKGLGNDYKNRLTEELTVIENFGFCNYCLVVSDLLKWCRENNIQTGPGRGSAVNSLVNYLLEITAIDPVKYNLDFARFLNEGRLKILPSGEKVFTSMIDVDCDISQDDRMTFLQHVKDKYGNVYHMGTNTRFTPKTAVKVVGTVYDKPFGIMNGLTKIMQERLPGQNVLVSIADNLKKQDVNDYVVNNKLQSIVSHAEGLEGGLYGEGTHASGIVISRNPIDHIVPLRKSKDSPLPTIDWDMEEVETYAKQIKFDFLGLRTISIIHNAEQLILDHNNSVVIPEWGDFSDTSVISAKNGLDNIFQLSSSLAIQSHRKIGPQNEEELSDELAILRPGANECLDEYASGGKTWSIPVMNTLLKRSRGIIIYQEDLMEIAKAVAGFSSPKADDLRKACGKKKVSDMKKLLPEFSKGAKKNGYKDSEIEEIMKQMLESALYSFNKGHSMGYAAITYKTLWLKHHHPVEFYVACLNSVLGKADKITETMKHIQRNKIPIRVPDINKSGLEYKVLYENGQRFILPGLRGIKGVGDKAALKIMDARPFAAREIEEKDKDGKIVKETLTAMEDFISRVPRMPVNTKVRQALASAGAFDNIEPDRNIALSYAEEKVVNYDEIELALKENEVLGFFFTKNPYLEHHCYTQYNLDRPMDFTESPVEGTYKILGFLKEIKQLTSKGGNQYITGMLTDGIEEIAVLGFKNFILKYGSTCIVSSDTYTPVVIKGELKQDGEDIEEAKLHNFKLNMQTLNIWQPESGITCIRVMVGGGDAVCDYLDGTGDESIIVYDIKDFKKKIKAKIDDTIINTLKMVYNAKITYKHEDNS